VPKPSREYVAAHRARKAAEAFSDDYMKGVRSATPEHFIEAKESEICYENNCATVTMDDRLIRAFLDELREYDADEDKYYVHEMAAAWKRAGEIKRNAD